ncbi:MAG: methyltransferase [Clostridiales bacterium]|nr:methyltransferase [Clostridiales bacterium]
MPGLPPTQEFTYPVSQREGVIATYQREPIWLIAGSEVSYFAPKVHPDNVARATVMDGSGMLAQTDGPDMFGVEWEFVPAAGGSMVRPGNPMLKDANDWESVIKFPDIGKWDWAGSKAENKAHLSKGKFYSMWQLNGFFERLISFMEFENAAYALIDEDQQDAVKALFDKLADFYITLFDESLKHFPQVDGFFIHDDWGSQRAPFFSPAVAEEMLVPAMKKVTDYIHSRGRYAELHSCGHLALQVPNMIKAGWDLWCPQILNDTHEIFDLYGDKIIIGVAPTGPTSVFTMPKPGSEAEDIAAAESFTERFCRKDKPIVFNMYSSMMLSPAYRSALYKASRLKYQA